METTMRCSVVCRDDTKQSPAPIATCVPRRKGSYGSICVVLRLGAVFRTGCITGPSLHHHDDKASFTRENGPAVRGRVLVGTTILTDAPHAEFLRKELRKPKKKALHTQNLNP